MATDTVKICPYCRLVYRPDPRQHKNPREVCPKCGKRLVPEEDDDDEK